jgi:hypothetical protein
MCVVSRGEGLRQQQPGQNKYYQDNCREGAAGLRGLFSGLQNLCVMDEVVRRRMHSEKVSLLLICILCRNCSFGYNERQMFLNRG